MSKFTCEHGKLRTQCSLCGKDVKPRPLGENIGSWETTWHAHRRDAHGRIAQLIRRVQADGSWTPETYYSVYDKPAIRQPRASEMEDPTTLNGGFWLAMIKMTDLTIDGRRFQDYNAESEWEDVKTRLYKRYDPSRYPELINSRQLKIHGGNAAWSHQQRAPDLARSPHLWQLIRTLSFGDDEVTPDKCDDATIADRIGATLELADSLRVRGMSIPFCSKLLISFDPKRWPVLNTRANPVIGGAEFEEGPSGVRTPAAYVDFAHRCRELIVQKGLPDMEMLDISFSNRYDSGPG